jgi:prepilin-type processing-associated H-X9-DG protein
MLEIGKALIVYAKANHRHFPPSLDVVLKPGVIRASRDAGERASYIYLGRGLSYPHAGPSLSYTVLMYEPLNNRHGGGINVLFADGHVEHLFPKEVPAMLAGLKAGRNPPGAATRP